MKRNNKGFTLVELLAAIVIIGILSVLSIPVITGMIEKSRNKIYITDAKKLISQAEYKIRASSSNIEKPDPGDCIALSLVYLDSPDLDNPPNGGKYEKESSFVLVKNNNGKLEYSATIVEKMKQGGYKGVELTTNEELISGNAMKHVVVFDKNKIITVEDGLTKAYVNSKLGTDTKPYIESGYKISAVYNYPDLSDHSSNQVVDKVPSIVKATLTSSSNKGFNTVDATLTLKVADDDTPGSKLRVIITGSGINIDEVYGTTGVYIKNFDFSKNGYSYSGNRNVSIKIRVVDPEGNSSTKTVSYPLHQNEAPVIDKTKTTLTKRSTDVANMITSQFKLSVSDDIDKISDLQVCFSESTSSVKPSTCNGYKKFYDYFKSSGENTYTYDYKFMCGGSTSSKCSRDGSKHYLTVFVKDTSNLVSSELFEYQFSSNMAPSISNLKVTSVKNSVPESGNKTVDVTLDASDDSDDIASLKVIISSGGSSREYSTYGNNKGNVFDFTIPNVTKYDGSSRVITVTLEDKEGLRDTKTVNYSLYNNKAPVINSFSVYSNGVACDEFSLCPETMGGSKNALISLSLTDDLDRDNNYSSVKVCVSEKQSDCNNINDLSHYVSYYNYVGAQKDFTFSGDYDGSEKTVYAYAVDTYNVMSNPSTFKYKLYSDRPPVINNFIVESEQDAFTDTGNLDISYYIDAYDDFEDVNDLKFELLVDGNVVVNKEPLEEFLNKANHVRLPGVYDGGDRRIVARVYDKTNKVVDSNTSEVLYTVYLKDLPVISNIQIDSRENICNDIDACSSSLNNSLKVNYKITVLGVLEDEFDSIQVCVSDNETCTNYSSLSDYIDRETRNPKTRQFEFTNGTKPYDGTVKQLHVYLRNTSYSSSNNVVHGVEEYSLYNNNAPVLVEYPTITPVENRYNVNSTDVVYSIRIKDDLDSSSNLQIKYCNTASGSEYCTNYQSYNEKANLNNDNFFKVNGYSGQGINTYAYIKDSYGAERKVGELTYTLYNDMEPTIDTYSGAYDIVYKDGNGNVVTNPSGDLDQYTKEFVNYRVSFNISDPMDTYRVCVSDNKNSCSSYSTEVFDGNSYEVGHVNVGNLDSNKDYYLFVKDSNNHVKVSSNKIAFDQYGVCAEVDVNTVKYEYKFDSSKKYYNSDGSVVTNNQRVTPDLCSGRCYSGANTSFTSFYDKIPSYLDRFTGEKCNFKEVTQSGRNGSYAYKADCSFKDCFYKNNNYQRRAIGTTKHDAPEAFTTTVNGTVYNCTKYYVLYYSSYKQDDEFITLTPTNNRICAEAVDAGEYNYKSSDSDPYVRVAD